MYQGAFDFPTEWREKEGTDYASSLVWKYMFLFNL